MRNLKRLLTMTLALAFMMSLMVVSAGATSFKDDKDITNKTAVDKMVSLNIIKGRDNGNFDPTGIVTRAEMAKMICVALNGGNDPQLTSSVKASFTDTVGHWAAGYIEYCVNMGNVAGMGNNTFAPDQGVTGSQASKMLLVALGYDAVNEKFTGPTWALSTNKVALQKGLYDEIKGIDPNAPLTRDNAAQMVFNFCNANMVKYEFGISGSGSNLSGVKQANDIIISTTNGTNKYETILTKYYKLIDSKEGYLNGWSYDKDKKEYKYSIADSMNATVVTEYKTTQDFTGMFGMKVKLFFKDKNNNGRYDSNDDTIFDIAAKDSKMMVKGAVVGDWDTIKADDTDFTMNGVTYKLTGKASEVKVYKFGENTATGKYLHEYQDSINAVNPYTFDLIDNTGDGEADAIIVHPFFVKKLSYVDAKSVTTDTKTYKFDDADIYKDAAKSDWAMITAGANAVSTRDTLEKVAVVTGTIDSVKSSSKIVVGGKTYENANGATGDTTYKIGNKMELVVVNGYIFNAKKLASSASKETVVLVIKADPVGTGTDAETQKVSAVFSDGTKKTITVDKINDFSVKDAGTVGTVDTGDHFLDYSGKTGTDRANYTLYSYNKDKDGNYELTPYNAPGAAKDYDNSYVAGSNTYFKDGKLVANGTTSIRFDDDAVVFYYYTKTDGSIEYKVATGAVVTKWAEVDKNKGMTGTAYTNEKDGFQYAQIAALNMGATVPSDDSTLYGYIVASPELMKQGDDYYYKLKIWNGKETLERMAKGTDSQSTIGSSTNSMETDKNVKKGTPISYKTAGDNMIDSVKTLKSTANAIVAYTDGKSFVGMQNAESTSGLKDLKITSDTKVIRFSYDKTELADGDGITVAKETSVGSGVYYNNCYVEAKTDGDIKVLIIDKDSNMPTTGVTGTVSATQANTQAKLNDLFKAYDTVNVTGAYAPVGAITIDSGKTLNVTGTVALDVAATDSTVNGTLTASGAITGGAKLIVAGTLNAGATLDAVKNVTANGVINATGAITTVTANAGTINATGAITTVTANAGTINVNADLTIGTLTANAGTIKIATGKTLTLTDAAVATIYQSITAEANTAKLSVKASTAGTNAADNTWYTAAGDATHKGTSLTGVVVEAGTYTWSTVYTNDTGATKSAWLK